MDDKRRRISGLTERRASGKGMPMKKQRVNVRRPEVMKQVASRVKEHYRSEKVDAIRAAGDRKSVV